jgi:hypothetical protein
MMDTEILYVIVRGFSSNSTKDGVKFRNWISALTQSMDSVDLTQLAFAEFAERPFLEQSFQNALKQENIRAAFMAGVLQDIFLRRLARLRLNVGALYRHVKNLFLMKKPDEYEEDDKALIMRLVQGPIPSEDTGMAGLREFESRHDV